MAQKDSSRVTMARPYADGRCRFTILIPGFDAIIIVSAGLSDQGKEDARVLARRIDAAFESSRCQHGSGDDRCDRMATVDLEWADRTRCVCTEHVPATLVDVVFDHHYDRSRMNVSVHTSDRTVEHAVKQAVKAICDYLDTAQPDWCDRTLRITHDDDAWQVDMIRYVATRAFEAALAEHEEKEGKTR